MTTPLYEQLCQERRWVDHRIQGIPLGQVGRPLPQPTRKQVRTAKKVGTLRLAGITVHPDDPMIARDGFPREETK